MKKLYAVLLVVFVSASMWPQSPQKMSYQAVIRNNSNVLITSTTVGMQISILQGSSSGIPVYVENQTPTTNSNGLVSLEIGSGTIVSGTFSAINWANGPYFIKTETDITGGATYSISGVSELMSVPYALFSANSIPGPQGLQGIPGNNGATGPMGPQGITGNNGIDGATGPMGPQGIAGNNGINGATGPMGPQGIAGNNGIDGATGPMGPQGIAGNNGTDGATGPMGSQGIAGNNGIDGATGPMGPQGIAGNNGTDGATGPMGPQGIAGNNGTDGATGPMGPQGIAGNNGIDGATGPMGPQGIAGNNGIDGATGPMGPQGIAGNNGIDGATGPQGPQGAVGPSGPSGSAIVPIFLTKSTDYTIQNTDVTGELYIEVTGDNSSIVTFTLPSAATVGAGKKINIFTSTTLNPNKINVVRSGSDTMLGIYCPPGTTNFYAGISYNPANISLVSDGISKWLVNNLY